MYVIVLSTVHSLTRVTANEEVARVEDAIKLYASHSHGEKTRIRVGGISQSQQMRHFDVLQTAGLGRLHSKDRSGIAHLADRVQKTQGRAGPQMNPHLVSALDATNYFFRGADLGHLSRNSCRQLADLRIRSGENGGGNGLRGKLGEREHLQKTRTTMGCGFHVSTN